MPYSLNGAILAATGGPTVNEGQLKWFQDHGAPGVADYNDAERRFLEVSTSTPIGTRTAADMWRELLTTGGYWLGDMNESMRAYWVANATLPPEITFTASEYQVENGGSVDLTWSIAGAVAGTASATPVNAQWTGAKPVNGQATITNLTANQRFTLEATNGNGTTTVNVDIEVVSQTVTTTMTVGQSGAPDDFGFISGFIGSLSPTAMFGGTCIELRSSWNGFDTIVVGNTGSAVFPDVGTAQLQLTVDGGGANKGPFTLTWNGSRYALASNALAYYLSSKVGTTVSCVLEKL